MNEESISEVVFMPDGAYRCKYYKLTIKALKNYRSRLLTNNMKLRQIIQDKYAIIEDLEKQLRQNQDTLNRLPQEKIEQVIQLDIELKKQVNAKATLFLKDYLGEEAYNQLQEKGFYCFVGADHKKYRIKSNGELQQSSGKYWLQMCVIKPKDLPLPDIISAIHATVANNPVFSKSSRATRTTEEVTA